MIEKMIDVGGFRLFMREMGHSGPTVIFESAMGNSLKSWFPIQVGVSNIARTITYDRAGNGKSERSSNPRTCLYMARELNVLLKKAGIDPPFIFVGASYGAYIIRTYSHLYADETAAIVLVEPSHEDYLIEIRKTRSENEWQELKKLTDLLAIKSPGCFKEEWDNFFNDSDYVRKLPFSKNIPITVITSARYGIVEKTLMKQKKEDIDIRCSLHKQWTLNNLNMKQVITDKSGHDVILEEPELVIDIIKGLIRDYDLNNSII